MYSTRDEATTDARESGKNRRKDKQGKIVIQKIWDKPENNCDEGREHQKRKTRKYKHGATIFTLSIIFSDYLESRLNYGKKNCNEHKK
jgi:hypothetical protein